MQTKSRLFQAKSDDCRVAAADLGRLDQVKELLRVLNDPYAGPQKMVELVEQVPVLMARCRREAALVRPRKEVEAVERALNVLGNRGVEKVLLELLEDLTILKSELEVGRASGK